VWSADCEVQSIKFVSAPCGLILEILNLEKMQHVKQKMHPKNANKKQLQKEIAKKNINAQKMQMQKRNAKQI